MVQSSAMKYILNKTIRFLTVFLAVLFYSEQAVATQRHGGIEGVIVHQMAHLFFAFSMGMLIYWLRERNLIRETGWRLIQYAALFFILWNIDAFTVHFLDDQTEIIRVQDIDLWHIQIKVVGSSSDLGIFYYLAKLDHLLCVPAVIFLFAGLRCLLKETGQNDSGKAQV